MKGLTLIEALVILIVMTVLILVSAHVYRGHLYKSRRMDGITTLLAVAESEHEYFVNNARYADLDRIWGGTSNSELGFYEISIEKVSVSGYVATAQALRAQSQDKVQDQSCAKLTLTVERNRLVKTPAVCWGSY